MSIQASDVVFVRMVLNGIYLCSQSEVTVSVDTVLVDNDSNQKSEKPDALTTDE